LGGRRGLRFDIDPGHSRLTTAAHRGTIRPRIHHPGGLRRDDGEDHQRLLAGVDDVMLDARRHDYRVERLQILCLGTGPQVRFAFEDQVELVRGGVGAAQDLLPRLQAEDLAHQPRAVDQAHADRALAQEMTRLTKADDVHGYSLTADGRRSFG
jgi:hypothetical protein